MGNLHNILKFPGLKLQEEPRKMIVKILREALIDNTSHKYHSLIIELNKTLAIKYALMNI